MTDIPINLHGTCVTIKGHGVLLIGPSGSGKSDCALRLLDAGAMLVSDDRVILTKDADRNQLIANAPDTIKDMLEVRGIGILKWQSVDEAPLRLIVEACNGADEVRMPDQSSDGSFATFAEIKVPKFQFDLRHAAAPAKIRVALDVAIGARHLID